MCRFKLAFFSAVYQKHIIILLKIAVSRSSVSAFPAPAPEVLQPSGAFVSGKPGRIGEVLLEKAEAGVPKQSAP